MSEIKRLLEEQEENKIANLNSDLSWEHEQHKNESFENCSECIKEINSDVCPICNGTEVVSAMDYVYPGEPHMADVGEQPCECVSDNEPDDFSGASEGDR